MNQKQGFLFVIIFLKLALCSCREQPASRKLNDRVIEFERAMDSTASVKIDSAYRSIQQLCDTARKYRLPLLVDSILKADSTGRADTTKHRAHE
jgi:hypothetical protein